ncbi:MAG TPA: tetratricopeptide repeat protein, partial [Patescibacteria group bacterium]|nr:tetratricopeptide repeat protein [Patescibacteria group bacterium]
MSSRRPIARLVLAAAVLGAGGLVLIVWSYLKVERSVAARGVQTRNPARTEPAAAALRNAEMTKARDLLESGDNAGAVAALDRALAAAPHDAEVLALQVRALRSQRRYTAARSTARRILDSFPRSPLAHLLLGSIAIQEGDAATARRDLQHAVDLDTSSALAVAQLGWLDLMEGRVAEAHARAKQALALDPRNAMALRALTRMSRSAPELRSLYERLVQANPGDPLDRSWLEVLRATASPEVNYIPAIAGSRSVACEAGPDGRLYLRARVGPFERL